MKLVINDSYVHKPGIIYYDPVILWLFSPKVQMSKFK